MSAARAQERAGFEPHERADVIKGRRVRVLCPRAVMWCVCVCVLGPLYALCVGCVVSLLSSVLCVLCAWCVVFRAVGRGARRVPRAPCRVLWGALVCVCIGV